MPIHPTSWRCFLIFFHLRLGLPTGLFTSGLPTKVLCGRLLSPIRSTCPSHLIFLDFITRAKFVENTAVDCHVTSSALAPSVLVPSSRHRMVVGCQPYAPAVPRKYSWYSFLLEAESTQGAIVRSKGFYVNEKSTDTSWDRTSDLPICSTAP